MKRFLLVFAGVIVILGIVTFFLPVSDFTIEGANNYYSENELREKITEGRSSTRSPSLRSTRSVSGDSAT